MQHLSAGAAAALERQRSCCIAAGRSCQQLPPPQQHGLQRHSRGAEDAAAGSTAAAAARSVPRQQAVCAAHAGRQSPQMVLQLAPPGTAPTEVGTSYGGHPLQQQQQRPRQQQHHQHATTWPDDDAARSNWMSVAPTQGPAAGASRQQRGSSSASRKGGRVQGRGGGGGVPLERVISSCIKQCTSWQQVDVVVREYGPAFNIIHIAAAITHLAQLTRQPPATAAAAAAADACQQQHAQHHSLLLPPPPLQQQQQHHLAHTQPSLVAHEQQQVLGLGLISSQMEQQHLQALLLARSGQQQQQQHDLVARLLDQAVSRLHEAGSRQVANMLWALSVLQPLTNSNSSSSSSSSVSQSVELLVARAAQVFGSAEAQHLSNMALAAAKLGVPVGREWVQQMAAVWLQLARQQGKSSSSSSSSLDNSRSVQSHVVGSRVRSRLGGDSSSRQQQFGGGSSAAVPSAHAECQQVELTAGLGAAEQAAGVGATAAAAAGSGSGVAGASNAQATCNFLWALVQLQQPPEQEWLWEVVAASVPQLPAWSAKHVAMFMWACARLGFRLQPASPWRSQAVAAGAAAAAGPLSAAQQQQQLLPQTLQHSIAGCMADALQRHARGFSSRDLAQSLWAAAVMGLHVPDATLQLLLTSGPNKQLPQQQQVPSSELGHSVSMLLWSVGHLRQGQQLPGPVLQPWVAALMAHAARAPGQSLGVAAWAAGQLRLTATCPQLLLRLVQTAAHRQQQQPRSAVGGAGSSRGMQSPATAAQGAADQLPAAAVAAVLWAAARCVAHAEKQQQPSATKQEQQQQPQHARRQPAAGVSHSRSLQHAIKVAATGLALQAAAPQQHQQQQEQLVSLWQFALVLWSASAMRLQLPVAWWRQQLLQLQGMLQQQQQQNQWTPSAALPGQQQQQQEQHAHAIAVSVWALGRSRLRVSSASVLQLQQASLAFLQQQPQQQRPLSQEGCVLLLLGFTHMATTAAARLPARTAVQRCWQHKRYRLLAHKLTGCKRRWQQHKHKRARDGGLPASVHHHHHQQQQHSQQEGGASQAGSSLGQPQQQQQKNQRQRPRRVGLLKGSVRRPVWWRRHLQQQRARAEWRRVIWQQQRHGWVAAAGLQASWLRAYCAYTQPLLARMGPNSLVAVMWALGRLRWHPGGAFMAAAQHRVGQVLPLLQPRHTALLLWSLARLNHVPDAVLWDAWELQLASASIVDLQQAGWAQKQLQLLARLRMQRQPVGVSGTVIGSR